MAMEDDMLFISGQLMKVGMITHEYHTELNNNARSKQEKIVIDDIDWKSNPTKP